MSRGTSRFKGPTRPGWPGFTLVELLIVIVVIALLAALLLPVLSGAKAQAQCTACKNNLRQMGLGLHMYLLNNGRYPPEWGRSAQDFLAWADRAMESSRHSWTNSTWQCPSYVARNGIVKIVEHPRGPEVFTSYAYNEWGMVDTSRSQRLGLGLSPGSTVVEVQIAAPSEMIAVADSRTFRNSPGPYGLIEPLHGLMQMQPFFTYPDETGPIHGTGYNVLFADGHVALLGRKDYLNPPRAASHWNRDNQPHPELWRATNEWAQQR